MASSNRHWPSMFKSKPHPHQWQQDINSPLLPSSTSPRSSPYSSSGCEVVQKNPEPKPRWNPRPEQIRILEAIFNSGMVNPPRDEIRRIRAQLQEYGQVGDANVFYWFQNRKSRSKHKLRLLHNNSRHSSQPQQQPSASPSSSSSSSSSKSTTPRKNKNNQNTKLSLGGGNPMMEMPAFLFHAPTVGGFDGINVSSGLGFLAGVVVEQHQQASTVGPCTGLLLNEIMKGYGTKEDEEMMMKSTHQAPSYNNNIMHHVPHTSSTVTPSTTLDSLVTVPSTSDKLQLQVVSRVFINEMEFEVNSGQFNVRDAFGEDAFLIDSAGQPIVTDEYGVALRPLQHGASYYLI